MSCWPTEGGSCCLGSWDRRLSKESRKRKRGGVWKAEALAKPHKLWKSWPLELTYCSWKNTEPNLSNQEGGFLHRISCANTNCASGPDSKLETRAAGEGNESCCCKGVRGRNSDGSQRGQPRATLELPKPALHLQT